MSMIIEAIIANHDLVARKQIAIEDSKIVEVGDNLGNPNLVLEDNCLLFPGFVDLHVHAREDTSGKQCYKETYQTAVQAARNGGVVAFADMPNNPVAPVDRARYTEKRNLVKGFDFPILPYAGIGPETEPLFSISNNLVPYKVFMGQSVGDLFFRTNEELEAAISRYRGRNISWHCEDPLVLAKNEKKATHEQRRPPFAETSAIRLALDLTRCHGIESKICHVSTRDGLGLCLALNQREKREPRYSASVEVTPHHLFFDTDMLTPQNRTFFMVNPPIRSPDDREYLLQAVRNGNVDYLASDHAPHTFDEKMRGTSGLTHLDTYGLFAAWLIKEQGVTPHVISQICSHKPGRFIERYMGRKLGRIAEGYEARFTVIDLSKSTTVTKASLKTKCGWSPFEGFTFPAEVKTLIL